MRKCEHSLLFLTFALLMLSTPYFVLNAEAGTLTLSPSEDSYVDDTNPSSNYGGMSYLKVSESSNMFVGECLAYLKFDLSAIPAGALVDSAKLELYTSIYLTSTHHISAHYSSDNSWTELGITYANHPSFNTTPTSTTPVASTSAWYEWAVSTDVQTALGTTDRKITIVLKSDYHDGADQVWFESRDQQYSWMEDYIPKLVVSYSPADTVPPSIKDIQTNPNQPLPEQEVQVIASVTDSSGVKKVILCHSTDGGTTWSNTSMSLFSGSKYTASIPAQSEGTIVKYYIEAQDNSLNKATSITYSYTATTESISTTASNPISGVVIGAVVVVLVIGAIVGFTLLLRSRKKIKKIEVPPPP